MPRDSIDVTDLTTIVMEGKGMEKEMDVSEMEGEIDVPEGITYSVVE